MSDFLSNLAARSLGAAEVIRPRVPSLFEPYRPNSGLGERRVVITQESALEQTSHRDTQPQPQQVSTREVEAVEHGPEARVGDRFGPPESSRSRSPAHALDSNQSATAAHAHVAIATTVAPPSATERAMAESMPARRDFESTRKPVFRDHPQPDLSSPAAALPMMGTVHPPVSPRYDASRTPAKAEKAPDETGSAVITKITTEGSHLVKEPEIVNRPVLEHRRQPAEPKPDSSAPLLPSMELMPRSAPFATRSVRPPVAPPHAGRSESTIQVTIGRVEVRAVFPEPPARRIPPARPRPSVSLDDYLKRGSGKR